MGNKILVVEDELEYQNLMMAILAGYEVTVCGTSEEALTAIQTEKFDLIILDINLFGMSGLEFLGILHQQGLDAKTPVLMCSSQTDPETKDKAKKNGAAGFIPKPYSPEGVVAMVSAILESGAPTEEKAEPPHPEQMPF